MKLHPRVDEKEEEPEVVGWAPTTTLISEPSGSMTPSHVISTSVGVCGSSSAQVGI